MSRLRFKIWWFMGATILVALFFGVLNSPFDPLPLILFMIPISTFLVYGLYVALVVAPYSIIAGRKACPSCGARTMECLSVNVIRPPPSSWHRCRRCETIAEHRLIKGWVQPSTIEPWWDEELDHPNSEKFDG
ncbi:hypothetical protein SAMN05444166_1689 [Singulisphaera sp. GP187]|nr:hypothetical protein SAMN05444166_1689 [Singulisphaera sp. GP187]